MNNILMHSSRSNRKKGNKGSVLKIFLILILVAFIGIFAMIPHFIMKDMINGHIEFKYTYKAEDFGLDSQTVVLRTADGLNVTAYEVYTEDPKAVVIFLSGIHNPSVTAFYGHSKMIKDEGYASLLVEMRAHGESEGNIISLGYKEYLDVEAAVKYIRGDARYSQVPIVVFGLSMGGATAINSIGQITEIDGLISLSAYSSFEDVFIENMISSGIPKLITVIQRPFVKLYTALKFGLGSYKIYPKEQIKNLGNRPALLIHSEGDSQIPYASFTRILAKAPNHVETWVRKGDLHLILEDDNFLSPYKDMEYKNKVIGFLNKHFQ